jgi:ATP-dependent DNA helicase RecG
MIKELGSIGSRFMSASEEKLIRAQTICLPGGIAVTCHPDAVKLSEGIHVDRVSNGFAHMQELFGGENSVTSKWKSRARKEAKQVAMENFATKPASAIVDEMSKAAELFLNASKEIITESSVIENFITEVVPTTKPEPWLKKQNLLRDNRPTVAGVLIFAEEPQAVLPKNCGIKVYRYKTRELEGHRDLLDGDPKTIEGDLYTQIMKAVETTKKITEAIPKFGGDKFETIQYPHETLHEILANAVLHRDYSIRDDIHIRIFDDRIEVQSPGRLPSNITPKNILEERFARNGAIVRILNKFPEAPNKDVGEGLNTAFTKMKELGLKPPIIRELENAVLVIIKHEPLASAEEIIYQYLQQYPSIKNRKAREITHNMSDFQIKGAFNRLAQAGKIEKVPGTKTSSTAWRLKKN